MIDVILTCKDAAEHVEQSIHSILNQTFKDFRLFVFDDASEDDTIKKVKSFKDARLTVISSYKNIGTYAGKNFVLKNFVTSPFVALHDADDISLPYRFEKQIKQFSLEDESLSCLGTSVLEFWNDQNFIPHTASLYPAIGTTRINTYPENLSLSDVVSVDGDHIKTLKSKICMNGTVIFRKKSLFDIGGWDGNTRFSGDSDVFLRVLGMGGRIKNLQDILYLRRFHSKSLTAAKDTGINSTARTTYNESILPDVAKCSLGATVKRNFFYPAFDYIVTQCAE